jgi:4-aminobutyrate aminotransferase/(S)-3-amino-2-methylpropionate transaminase
MLAMELVEDPSTKAPAAALAGRVVAEARDRGVIVIKAGVFGNVVRILVPLCATDEEVRSGMEMLAGAVEEACT